MSRLKYYPPISRRGFAFPATLCAISLLLPIAIAASDEEPLIVTANRIAAPEQKIGATIHTLSEKEIERMGVRTVEEALRSLPGMTLSRTGINGPSSLFIRGAKTEHTLVLVDGVPIGDPMGTGRAVDYTLLGNLTNIERIEVLKGPQSTLYGSSGMGGVVQLFTKRGGDPKTSLGLEAGTESTYRATLSSSGMKDRLSYSFAGSIENSHGIDATVDQVDKSEKDRDRDHYRNRILSANINYELSEMVDVDLIVRYNRRYHQYDNQWNKTHYDDYVRSEHWVGYFALNGHFFDERWDSTISYGVSHIDRKDYSGMSDWLSGNDEQSFYRFKGETQNVTWHNQLTLNPNFTTLFGATYQHEKGEGNEDISKSQNRKSLYLDQHFDYNDRIFNTLGVRYDDNSTFGGRTTFRVTSRINLTEQFALKGSYGTGFNAPNIYQLYDRSAGNRGLKAERSRGFDIGILFKPTAQSQLELTYFNQRYKEMIDYYSFSSMTPDGRFGEYRNLEQAKMRGIELSGLVTLSDQLEFGASYTYLDAKERSEGAYKRMLRRPKHQATLALNYQPTERWNLHLQGNIYSSRKDFGDEDLSGFGTADITLRHQATDRLEVTARVENLFDKKYHYAKGYREPGIRAFIGINIDL